MTDKANTAGEVGNDKFESPARLGFWQRTMLLAAAAFLGTVGIGSIFHTNNEAATAVLVTGAIILVVIAVIGEVPLRGSIGGIDWDLTRRLLQSTDRRVAAETAEEVLTTAQTRSVPDDVVESARHSQLRAAFDYERDVLQALRRIAETRNYDLVIGDDRRGPDALVMDGDRTALVEIKTGRFTRVIAQQTAELMRRHLDDPTKRRSDEPPGVLLVAPDMAAFMIEYFRGLLPSGVRLSYAIWDQSADDALLGNALQSALYGH